MPKQRAKEEMQAYQAQRRARLDVTPGVTPARRHDLRARLDQYKQDYYVAARRQDWARCTEINREREPLFWELRALERDLPAGERYWLPARVLNEGFDLRRGAKA